MTDEKSSPLVPTLRFPEFREAGEWEELPIGRKVDLLSGYPFKSSEISKDVNGIPLLRGINITEGYIRHSQDIDRFFTGEIDNFAKYRLHENDIVIGMDGSKVGKNAALITTKDTDSLLIQRVARLRTSCLATIQFIFQQINSKKFHLYVDKINTSGGIPHISAKQINEFEIYFPTLPEQQKIAACLSSLDELIAAHSQKLDALKKHKKGLMQQLFPAEGQTVPSLRFPEFSEAGEWVEKKLGEIATYENGKAHEQDISESGNFIVVNSKFISTDMEIKKFTNSAHCLAKKEDILMVLSDVPNGRAIAKCLLVNLDNLYTVNQRICKITPHNAVNNLLFYILNRNSYFLAFDDGVKQTNLRKEDVLDCPIFLPKDLPEQQKIAACLSSLDELITAHSKKLDALKKHKKGLMQQLFPAVEED